jgi:hypothetical protein
MSKYLHFGQAAKQTNNNIYPRMLVAAFSGTELI